MDDSPRLTSQMRALLECSVLLPHDIPISHSLLHCMMNSAHDHEFESSIAALVKMGLFKRVDQHNILVTPAGYEFRGSRRASDNVRLAMERGLILRTLELLDHKDIPGLRTIRDHLWAVTMTALPRIMLEPIDEEARLLTSALGECLALLQDANGLRRFSKQLDQLRPSGKTSAKKKASSVLLTPAMTLLLQCAMYLPENLPFPRTLLADILDPQSEAEQAILDLIDDHLFEEVDNDTLRITAAARKVVKPGNLEVKEVVLDALIDITIEAVEHSDLKMMRCVDPHLRALTTEFLPQADESACVFATWTAKCLMGLQDFDGAVYYAEIAERLQKALGVQPDDPAETKITRDIAYVGLQYYIKHDYLNAKLSFEQVIQTSTDPAVLAPIYHKLGECYGQLNDPIAEASAYLAALENAIRQHGTSHWELARYRTDLALILIHGGQFQAAEQQLSTALAECNGVTNPIPRLVENKTAVLLMFADLRFKQQRADEAKLLATQVLATLQQIQGHWTSRIQMMYFLASLYIRNNERELARSMARQAFSEGKKQLDLTTLQGREIYNLIKSLMKQLE